MKVDVSECLTAISLFARAAHTFETVAEGGGDESVVLEDIYSALTKAEKLCGHVRAPTVHGSLDAIREDGFSKDDWHAEFHDYMTTQLVLDLARGMEEKK